MVTPAADIFSLLTAVEQPDVMFRSAPFWAWNARLDEDELRRQIRLMHQMGYGGFFMHPRVGLATPYLSDEFFRMIHACIDEAGKLGMKAYLYDEDRWPSGAAGGKVTADKSKRICFVHLVCGESAPPEDETVLPVEFAILRDGKKLLSYRKLAPGETLPSGMERCRFFYRFGEDSPWFNNQGYISVLNKSAVDTFIDVTHETYSRECQEHFGKTVPGIFTDEPNYGRGIREDEFPWSVQLPEKFREKYHYDLLDVLPELFFDYEEDSFSAVRLDFFNLLSDLFVSAFFKNIGTWCEEHDLGFTGHVLCEDEISDQRRQAGAVMRAYEYMQLPGVDLLTEHWLVFNTAIQCASAARQFGRKYRLTETYGVTGWDFPLLGHKALGEWQLALGINIRCPHLAWYSMLGQAKRDYPASIFFQSPWMEIYHVLEDHFARLSAALAAGEECRDLLVIHPVESVFGTPYKHFDRSDDPVLDHPLIHLSNQLLSGHLEFDFGDEEMLSRHGSCGDGAFIMAQAAYKCVLIPRMLTIRSTTLDLLEKFADAGGKVFYLGTPPNRVDGRKSTRCETLFSGKFCHVADENCIAELEKLVRSFSFTGADGSEVPFVLGTMRRGADWKSVFLCNVGTEFIDDHRNGPRVCDRHLTVQGGKVVLAGSAEEKVYTLDTVSGRWHEKCFEFDSGKLSIPVDLDELGSLLLLITAKPVSALPEKSRCGKLPENDLVLTGEDSAGFFRLTEPNMLLLDHCRCTADGKLLEETFIFDIDNALRKICDAPQRGDAMCQPYAGQKEYNTAEIVLEYCFTCQDVPDGDLFLYIEEPHLYRIAVNGKPLEILDRGYWCDPAIRRIKLPAELLKTAENKLTLSCVYDPGNAGLESIFIAGNFLVENDCITSRLPQGGYGSWCGNGMPYYTGNAVYRFVCNNPGNEKTCFISIPRWEGAALSVSVNGNGPVPLLWKPFAAPITLQPGNNRIEIVVYGHRRNAFGPFYLNEVYPAWTGAAALVTKEKNTRNLVPCGLLEKPILLKMR